MSTEHDPTPDASVGVLIPGTAAPGELAEMSAMVERLGFGELWLSEDYFFLGGPTSAAVALAATSRITVGIGIMSAVVRHPAVTAMEIATLVGAYGPRLITGIGHGVPAWTRQMGLYPKSPLTSLRTAIETTRGLLEGQTITIDEGPFRFDDVSLTHPTSPVPPIYSGVIGPKSLEMSGACADGTIMSVIAAPKYLEYVREHIAVGAARAARDAAAHQLPTFVIYHVDEDGEKARAYARQALAFYLQAVGPTPMTGVYGYNDRLAELLSLGELEQIAAELPDDWVETFTIAGTPAECASDIRRFTSAGATTVVLAPFPAESMTSILETTAREVLPQLNRQ